MNSPIPRTNFQIANLSSAINNYPAIICPPLSGYFDRDDVLNAVIAHVLQTRVYELTPMFSTTFLPFKAVFKSDEHQQYIRELLMKSNTFPTINGRVPHIVCIRTEADAQQYDRSLWHDCMRDPSFIDFPRSTLFLCPSWEQTQVDSKDCDPGICPDVRGNMFASNAQTRLFPITRSFAITSFTLALYGRNHLINDWPTIWSIGLLNRVLTNGPVKSVFGDNRSYYLYLFREFDLTY